jgi:hypothetical protein
MQHGATRQAGARSPDCSAPWKQLKPGQQSASGGELLTHPVMVSIVCRAHARQAREWRLHSSSCPGRRQVAHEQAHAGLKPKLLL